MKLNDSAINSLVDATLSDNPTLAQVAAAIDEARATIKIARSGTLPALALNGGAAHGRVPNPQGPVPPFGVTESSATLGPDASWELDLWGRVRQSVQADRSRLTARSADADEARIAIVAQVASGVLSLRACEYALTVRDRDILARETELALMHRRLLAGNVALVQEAAANTNLANARTDQASQQQECTRDVDFLVALSGRDAVLVRALVAPSGDRAPHVPAVGVGPPTLAEVDPVALLPVPPVLNLALPATVLLHHPRVIAAEREVAARWSEIDVARAERLPKIDLAAALSGNWLAALGHTVRFATWSVGASFSAPLIDNGAGAAQVSGAEARYTEALAQLHATVRSAAQDVEDALAASRVTAGETATIR